MEKGSFHISTILALIIAAIILVIFAPMLIKSAGAVWNQILMSLGMIKPSILDKAILCSYYRCKYGIYDSRTIDACEGDFPDYAKASLDCDQGGLICMEDLFLPEGKVCDEVSAAYPIVVEVEEGKELEINKNNKFGDDGNADNLCVNYRGIEGSIRCLGADPKKEQTAGYGDYDECRNTHNCRLSTQFGYNLGHYGSEISKSIFLDSALANLGEDCVNSVKIKPSNKLYVTTDYYTRIFSEENRDKITNVVPTLLQLKVGETSHGIFYCGFKRKSTVGLFIIEDLDDDGNKENVTGVKVVGVVPLGIGPTGYVKLNASCEPDKEIKIEGDSCKPAVPQLGVYCSGEFCDGKYNLTAWVRQTSDANEIDLTIWVKRIGEAGTLPGGGLPP